MVSDLKMATVVRLKRRINEDPLEVLFLASKRHKYSTEGSSGNNSAVDKNVFKFAGTVASKDDGISVQVRDAIRKEKLEREYKQHQARIFGDIRQDSRKQSHQKSKQNRLKVTFKHRALELDKLDNIETKTDDRVEKICPKCGLLVPNFEPEETNESVTGGIQTNPDKKDEKSIVHETEIVLDGSTGAISKHMERSSVLREVKDNVKGEVNEIKKHNRGQIKSESENEIPIDRDSLTATCKCNSRAAAKSANINKSAKENDQNHSANTDNKQSNVSKTKPLSVSGSGSAGDGPVFCLVDMEAENDTTTLTMPSSLADQITCNSEPMVREFVSQQTDDGYVYDIYYTNSREFDFRLFERDLTFEAFNSDLVVDRAGEVDDDDFVYGDDNDDENAENNWRNDYPDEDPRFYNTDRSRYDYENDMTEYEAFQTETGDQLADWMSWRCNIDAGEDLSSDDDEIVDYYADKGSSYDAYYKRVKKEMDEDEDDDSDSELDIL